MLPFPGGEVLQQVRDKLQLEATAAEAGLKTPGSLFEGTAAELGGTRFRWPVVVKPARPVSVAEDRPPGRRRGASCERLLDGMSRRRSRCWSRSA